MLQNKVKLNKDSHQYYDNDGNRYMSVSKVLEFIKPLFKRDELSKLTAAKRGISQEEILAEWDATAKIAQDHGTDIHESLEYFQNTAQIKPQHVSYEPMIRSISATYNDYAKVYQEEILYDEEYMVAGMTDKLLHVTSHKNSKFVIEDFKTNLNKGIQFYDTYGKHLLHPVEHFESCNYNTYALQLSIYAWMYERMTGRRVRNLNIIYIPPTNFMDWKRIPVPYLKSDVENILRFYKESIRIKMQESKEIVTVLTDEPNFD